MTNLGLKAELRDGNTIRAYLDDLVLKKTQVQLWIAQADALPFETTVARVSRDTFVTAQTPPLPQDQQLNFSFMVDSRRFTAHTQVVSTGVFKIPTAVAVGERRERFRAFFTRAEEIEVFACERVSAPFISGRVMLGRLLDLSLQGLRVSVDELGAETGEAAALKRGDTFATVCISGLPYTPTIQCGGIVAHVRSSPGELSAGFLLTGLLETDRKNIERILARRFPTTFGQAFPQKHRKTDIADQAGAPVQVKEMAKAPEVVALAPLPATPAAARPARPEVTAVMRIRKAGRKILVISASSDGRKALAESMREDDFKQVFEAKSFLDAQNLARAMRFDLVLLDVKVGGHQGQMILEALHRHDLLLDTPVILVADKRDAHIEAVAEAIEAVHIHEKRASYEDLVPALYGLLT
ncbi:MAG: response regulator [Holophaga sp.]|nr:response regulator [Holophaga sp.]